jgi:hypothetical protein
LQLLVGESGSGKSVVSAQIFEARCEANELCFWLPAEYLESSATIEEALIRGILGIQRDLWPGAAGQVLNLLSRESRLTLIIDDVNRTRDPAYSVRKLIAWLYPRDDGDPMRNSLPTHVLCPVWPVTADQFSARADKGVAWRHIHLGVMDPAEAHAAIRKAASVAARALSPLDVESVSAHLGHDPYTIGLWAELLAADSTASPFELANNVQEKFFCEALARASAASALPAYTIDAALKSLGAEMLQGRELQPTNGTIEGWFVDTPDVKERVACSFTPRLLDASSDRWPHTIST